MQRIVKTNSWSVRFNLPAIPGDMGARRYSRNGTVTCICDTAEDALRLLREQHPDAIVWNLNHKGQDETFFEAKHVVLLERRASPDVTTTTWHCACGAANLGTLSVCSNCKRRFEDA